MAQMTDCFCGACPHWSAVEGCTWPRSAFHGIHVGPEHWRCLSWWLWCVGQDEKGGR